MSENIIGAMVRRYRLIHKLTMEELGALIQSNHSYISQLESGKLIPSADVLGRLAGALHVSADTLLGRAPADNEEMLNLLQNLGALEIDSPAAFLDALRSLPPNEQQILARMVRLSALDHRMKQPRAIGKRKAADSAGDTQVGS